MPFERRTSRFSHSMHQTGVASLISFRAFVFPSVCLQNLLEMKILFGIFITDIFDNTAKSGIVWRVFPILHQSADKITENPPKIVMSCIGEKTSGVGQHADKVSKYP